MGSFVGMTLMLLFGGVFLLKRLFGIQTDDIDEEYGRGAGWMITFIFSVVVLMWLAVKVTLWLFPQARYSLIAVGLVATYVACRIAGYVAPPKE